MSESMAVLDLRRAVQDAAWYHAGLLCTAPVLDLAAALLADLWAAGERHNLCPPDLDVAYRCLEGLSPLWRAGVPRTKDDAQARLRVLVEEFAALGVTADVDAEQGLVLIPRGPSTPT